MFDMRFLLPDIMRAAGIDTAYALEKRSRGRLPISTATRLVRAGYKIRRVDTDTLQALCDVFDVDVSDLLQRDKSKRR